jgi:hypothetical protein
MKKFLREAAFDVVTLPQAWFWRGAMLFMIPVCCALDRLATRAGGIKPDIFDYSYEGKP